MEIKELLEIMLDNVNQGKPMDHGLIGYNGAINLEQPEHVYRKPHTHITFDEYREIRNCNDNNTALNRLNLAVEKLMVVRAPLPVQAELPLPEGYVWNHKISGDNGYSEFIACRWTDELLIEHGYLLPVQKPSASEPPPSIKPYVDWVGESSERVWPDNDYRFTESQFSGFHPSEFRVKLVSTLNRRNENGVVFAGVVRHLYESDSLNDLNGMENLVNIRLNKILQNL